MLIVWPRLPWLDDRLAILAFLVIGAVLTAIVFRYATRRARKHNEEHPSDE